MQLEGLGGMKNPQWPHRGSNCNLPACSITHQTNYVAVCPNSSKTYFEDLSKRCLQGEVWQCHRSGSLLQVCQLWWPRSGLVAFVVDEVALEHVFFKYLSFPCNSVLKASLYDRELMAERNGNGCYIAGYADGTSVVGNGKLSQRCYKLIPPTRIEKKRPYVTRCLR